VNSLVIIAPVPVYFAAEQLQGSGILAVVITALIVAAGMQRTIGFGGRSAAVDVWRHITFILQAFAFFLIGMEFPRVLRALRAEDLTLLPAVVAVVLVILVATRALFTLGMTLGSPRLWGGASAAWRSALVLTWAGARGPVSGLAVFTIPVAGAAGGTFPNRDLLVATTFCIIVITLLLAPTVGPLARGLRLSTTADTSGEATARAVLLRAGLDRLDEAVTDADLRGDPIPGSTIAAVRLPLEHDLEVLEGSAEGQSATDPASVRALREAVLHAQQEELTRLRDAGDVPDQLARRLQVELDAAVESVRRMSP
jgi:CPA1 family monovalent cation:H+ antiporter